MKTPVGVLVQLEFMARLAAMQSHEYPECPEWRAERELLLIAEKLRTAEGQFNWQVPIVALELVARVMPAEAGSIARAEGLTHQHWAVRAAVARIAGLVADPDTALLLVDDAHPNVRTEALRTLALLAHQDLTVHAVTALESADYQLVLTAAQVLAEAPDAVALLPEVFAAFERLTKERRDTSRETRTALLDLIVELGVRVPDAEGWAVRLRPHTEDWDPVIAARVAEVQASLSGTADPVRPTYRTPAQPSEIELSGSPPCLNVHFAGADPWRLEMHLDRAPIAVARFWALVKAGYYSGQDVQASDHRQVLIGSPAANDFVGTDRYWRDEVGSPVRKGSLILRNHGRDTVDGRLQLVREDQRTADGVVTVLASVQESARRPVLPGDRIVRIVECPRPR